MLFTMVDGLDDEANVVVLPLDQLRFLWFRMETAAAAAAAAAAVVTDDGDAADAFRIRNSILLRSQSGHALIFGCLATGIISGNDDDVAVADDDIVDE